VGLGGSVVPQGFKFGVTQTQDGNRSLLIQQCDKSGVFNQFVSKNFRRPAQFFRFTVNILCESAEARVGSTRNCIMPVATGHDDHEDDWKRHARKEAVKKTVNDTFKLHPLAKLLAKLLEKLDKKRRDDDTNV
jgi:hypothetical protein